MAAADKRVLVVDDDADIRMNIKDILDDLGYRTDTAHDGPAALQLIKDNTYDVAILDFKMPGMDGAQLYREIRKLRPEIVAIMVTAYAGSTGAQEALDAGTWKVLRKPVDLDELLPLVAEASSEPIVLVVDDDADFCENLWQLLRDQNFRVSIAHGEQEGIRKANDSSCQVALVDLCLGSGDGLKVIDTIQQVNPNAKTILVTGQQKESEMQSMMDGRLDAICFKPVEMKRLMAMINGS